MDLNRNFGFKWDSFGSSKHPCSNIYRGSSPFSEPEAKAIGDFLAEHKNEVSMLVTEPSFDY